MPVTAADDLQLPPSGPGHGSFHLPALVSCIGDDPLQKGKAPSRLSQQSLSPISVLHAGGMHADRQQKAQRVGQDVALAAVDLLARIKPGRVERGPPLTPPLTL